MDKLRRFFTLQKLYIYLIGAGIGLALATLLSFLAVNHTTPKPFLRHIKTYVLEQETAAARFFGDTTFLQKIITHQLQEADWKRLEALRDKPNTYFIYEGDSLLYWSDNRVAPHDADVRMESTTAREIVLLPNGFYELIRRTYSVATDSSRNDYLLLALIPIYQRYPVENDYLTNGFLAKNVPSQITIQERATDYPFRMAATEAPLFYLSVDAPFTPRYVLWAMLALYGFIAGCVLLLLHHFALQLNKRYSPVVGILVLLTSLSVVRGATLAANVFQLFTEIPIFSSDGFIAGALAWSVADLLVNSLLAGYAAVMIHYYFRVEDEQKWTNYQKIGFVGFFYSYVFAGVFLISHTVKRLILDTSTSLNFNNVFDLNISSMVAIGCIVLVMSAFFMIGNKLNTESMRLQVPRKLRYQLLGTVLAVSVLIVLPSIRTTVTIGLLLFALLITILYEYFDRPANAEFVQLVIWLFLFSAYSSGLLFVHNNEKEVIEAMVYGEKLALERDLEAERRFDDLTEAIQADNFIKLIDNPFVPRRSIVEQVDKFYLGSSYLFNRFTPSVHLYSSKFERKKEETLGYAYFAEKLAHADTTLSRYLYFYTDGKGSTLYIAKIPIMDGANQVGYLVMRLQPKELDPQKVYPELLMDAERVAELKNTKFDYAVYQNDTLRQSKGYPYPTILPLAMPALGRYDIHYDEQRKYVVYNAPNGKQIAVGKDRDELLKPMSLFSYMFCIFTITIFIVSFVNTLFNTIRHAKDNTKTRASLRSRVQGSVISVIVFTFLVIIVVTVWQFRADSNRYHNSRLSRKASTVLAQAEYEMRLNSWDSTFLPDIIALSEIHRLDINLFSLDGRLRGSSQGEIYQKALISPQMPIVPYLQIIQQLETQYDYTDRVGNLRHRSAYLPLRNARGEAVAIIGLPYYSERKDLQKDVSDYLGALLNVYVFLLLIAGVAAILIASSITHPLTVLGSQIRQVSLSKKNTKLIWHTNDEIGDLIGEYNKMIGELERSASQLAKSEREGAWREMAKQVAHEIKNPLTPMKLSIQYLLRAYETRPEAIGMMLKRVATTLVEQIDSLSRIATEFSNFAKMPAPQNEHFIINDVLENVCTLFQRGEQEGREVSLQLTMSPIRCEVFTDKEQLGRVFNNVVKNAIQAIPDDRVGNIAVALNVAHGMAVVSVKDNGIGIPEDKRNAIFVPNFTTKNSGTGLGLAISKNIIENAGGSIYFDTAENVGTTFFIEIPIVKEVNN